MRFPPTLLVALNLGRQPPVCSSVDAPAAGASTDRLALRGQYPLMDTSIDGLRRGMEAGDFTAAHLVETYLARIDEVQAQLRVVIETAPDALQTARRRDSERSSSALHGPLHGIPVLIKDNIASKDALNTTSGATCLVGARPPRDATVVERLRRAGAVILGKTNMSQWANFRSSAANGSDGWSARGGQTVGAYHAQQYPCGSSSGSAVAVSIALSAAALGTETDGSIVCPAGYNNVVGIKPTVGLTPRDLVIPGSVHQDSVGPMARSVRDAALLLTAIAGRTDEDEATQRIPWTEVPDYAGACNASALVGARIGIPTNVLPAGGKFVMQRFDASKRALHKAGAVLVEPADVATAPEFFTYDNDQVIMSDFRTGVADYLGQLVANPQGIHSLQDIIDYTKGHPEAESYPRHDIGGLSDAARSPSMDSKEYQNTLRQTTRLAGEEGLLATLKRYELDAIVAPSLSTKLTTLAAVAGYPVISVPMGFFPEDAPIRHNRRGDLIKQGPNIPMGLQFVGRPFDEERLIGIAYAFEQATQFRHEGRPRVLAHTELADVIAAESKQKNSKESKHKEL